MVQSEQGYNAFQIIRPVTESAALRRFLATAELAGKVLFGNSEFEVIGDDQLANMIDDNFDTGTGTHDIRLSNVATAKHEVYTRNGLKVTLVDRRSPKTTKAQPLMRAYMRFNRDEETDHRRSKRDRSNKLAPAMPIAALSQAGFAHDIPSSEELRVEFTAIVPVNDPISTDKGVEWALIPNSVTPEAFLLHDEADICYKAFASLYSDLAYPTSKTTSHVSFTRTPKDASDEAIGKYIGFLQRRLPLELVLGKIEPKFPN